MEMETEFITNEELEGKNIRKIWYTNSYGERVCDNVWFENFECCDWEMAEILKEDEAFRRRKEDRKKFLISEEDKNKSGVYKIQLENKIYIGQTKDFNSRFKSHADTKRNKTETSTMIRNGATFEILEIEYDLNKRLCIETNYINQYIKDGYDVINKIIDTTTEPININNKTSKQNNCITFNKSDLDKITKLLSDNNIDFKPHKFRDKKETT